MTTETGLAFVMPRLVLKGIVDADALLLLHRLRISLALLSVPLRPQPLHSGPNADCDARRRSPSVIRLWAEGRRSERTR